MFGIHAIFKQYGDIRILNGYDKSSTSNVWSLAKMIISNSQFVFPYLSISFFFHWNPILNLIWGIQINHIWWYSLFYQYIRLVIRTLMANIILIYIPKPVSKSSYSKSESFFAVHISLKVQYTSIKKLYKTDNVTRHWDIKHMKRFTWIQWGAF